MVRYESIIDSLDVGQSPAIVTVGLKYFQVSNAINNRMYCISYDYPLQYYMILIVFSQHLKQCVHRKGFNHPYAMKWIMFCYDEKELVLLKATLTNISYQSKGFFQ